MKKICLLTFALMFSTQLLSQGILPSQRSIKYILKWSPLHFIGKYPTLQFALEQRLRKNFSLQYEAGTALFIPEINAFAEDNTFRYRGFKSKFEVRRYFNTSGYRQFYCAQELFYNKMALRKEENFVVHPDISDQSKDYTQAMTYTLRYREYGTVIKAGIFTPINRFCFDIHVGLAFTVVDKSSAGKPPEPTYTLPDDDTPGGGSILDIFKMDERLYIYPTIGVRLGYIIKQ
jgi:hypothetical protein